LGVNVFVDDDYGIVKRLRESGDDIRAPYYWEHQFAIFIEKMIALRLGVNWDEYCKALERLYEENTENN